jgi:hypothetical protein
MKWDEYKELPFEKETREDALFSFFFFSFFWLREDALRVVNSHLVDTGLNSEVKFFPGSVHGETKSFPDIPGPEPCFKWNLQKFF